MPGSRNQPQRLPRRGEVVGGFVVEDHLAQGGMGAVFVAREQATGRRVALKVLLVPSPARRERFEREARLGVQLDHPGITRVLEAGQHHGMAYLAMELVEGGRPLDAYARERALDAAGRVALMIQVCDALEAAHAVGVIHRDLKPDNLLVTPDGRVKVVDLGLAREADASDLTKTGDVLGTVSYMAPEQVKGQAKRADARTDVFALGTILFELIAGELPFRGQTPAEILRGILLTPPLDLRSLAPHAPPGLEKVVERALAKEPGDRYPQVADLRRDLSALFDPAQEAPARRLSAIQLGSLLVVGALVAVVASWSQRSRPPDPQPSVERRAADPLPSAPERQASLLQAQELLDAWPPREGAALEQALDAVGQADSGLAHRVRGRLLARLGRLPEAADAFSASIKEEPAAEDYYRRALLRRSSRDLGQALELGLPDGEARHAEALLAFLVTDLGEAERLTRQALTSRFERPPTPASRRLEVRVWRLLAEIRSAQQDPGAAEEYAARVAEIHRGDAVAMIARARSTYDRAGRLYRETTDDSLALPLLPTFQEANADAARALELLPSSVDARWVRLEVANYVGRITARNGIDPQPHLQNALDDATWITENAGPDARALKFRGLCHQYIYEYEKRVGGDTLTAISPVIHDLQASIGLSEDMDTVSVLAHNLLARAQLKLNAGLPTEGDYRALLEVATTLVERGGDIYSLKNGDAYFYRGFARLELGDDEGGLDDLAEAIRLDPSNGNGLPADLLAEVQERNR